MKKISSLILRISITFALLIFLFGKTDFRALFEILRHSDSQKMCWSFFFFLFLNILVLLRWSLLLRGLSIRVSIWRLLLSYLASLFFNLVLPSTIGGDAVRTLDISQHTKKHSSNILATVVLDRVSGFFGLMTVLVFSLIFGFKVLHDRAIFVVIVCLLFLMAFVSGIMFSGRFFRRLFRSLPFAGFREYLYKIHEATASYKNKKKILAGAWFFSVLIQAGGVLVYFWVAQAIGVHLDLVYFMIFVPVITAFSVIPISVGGLGVRDTASIVIFAKAGVSAEKAFALSLSNFGFMFILGVLGGVVYVFSLYRRRI